MRASYRRLRGNVGVALGDALGDLVLAIDHIGSTSVPGLGAKDVIDVQVTVADLDDPRLGPALARGGYQLRPDRVEDHRPFGDTRPAIERRAVPSAGLLMNAPRSVCAAAAALLDGAGASSSSSIW